MEAITHLLHQFGEIFDLFRFGGRMLSENSSSRIMFENLVSNSDISEQHKFLNHVIGLKCMIKGHIGGVVGFLIKGETHLGGS